MIFLKNDTLTQSQMLKDIDSNQFIKCQQDEINTFYNLDIMGAHLSYASPGKIVKLYMELQNITSPERDIVKIQVSSLHQR
jgi:hypothetical protein